MAGFANGGDGAGVFEAGDLDGRIPRVAVEAHTLQHIGPVDRGMSDVKTVRPLSEDVRVVGQFSLVDVGRDDHPAASDFLADQGRIEVFALGDEVHFGRDDAPTGRFKLRHSRLAFLRRDDPDQVQGV